MAATALLLSACAVTHVAGDDAASDRLDGATGVDGTADVDGSAIDSASDAWLTCGDPFNPGVPESWLHGCPPEGDEVCRRWAQTLTRSGYAHAFCHEPDWPGDICSAGDTCPPYFPGATQPPCVCGGVPCDARTGEVCVSATPDGPAHCQAPCTN